MLLLPSQAIGKTPLKPPSLFSFPSDASSFTSVPSLPCSLSKGCLGLKMGTGSGQKPGGLEEAGTQRAGSNISTTFSSLSLLDGLHKGPGALSRQGPPWTISSPQIAPPHTLTTKSHRIKMKSGSPSRSLKSDFSISFQPNTHTHTHTHTHTQPSALQMLH